MADFLTLEARRAQRLVLRDVVDSVTGAAMGAGAAGSVTIDRADLLGGATVAGPFPIAWDAAYPRSAAVGPAPAGLPAVGAFVADVPGLALDPLEEYVARASLALGALSWSGAFRVRVEDVRGSTREPLTL